MPFKGKVALVTGAGHGIGEATAKLLAEKGASVVCNSKSESCKRVADEIEVMGGKPYTSSLISRTPQLSKK